ncbi:RNA polymerase sigma factor [Chitinophaga vietnamensis]|uniref:RNA polymerase sigma factor n=1 Tax=Chitinophaga vietnamensis TaxID=2593957 RepID=UPI001178C39B|nr:RNA polymerase sigma-70 factor [Chitinophaga vietnamensis]
MNINEDRILFSRVAEGDEAAFRELYHRYNAVLAGSVRKLLKSEEEAAEVLQEVFLKVWMIRETLTDIDNPGGWLYRLSANYCLSVLRKHAKERYRQEGILEEDIKDQHDLSEGFDAKELQGLVKEAIEQLPASRREVFLLSMQEGKSRKEIAGQLDISEHTVKNQLLSARKFIREYLEMQTGSKFPMVLVMLMAGLRKFF